MSNDQPTISPYLFPGVACEHFGVEKKVIVSSTRLGWCQKFRLAIALVLRDRFELGYQEIAYILHRECHTTMIHGIKKARESEEILKLYEEIKDL